MNNKENKDFWKFVEGVVDCSDEYPEKHKDGRRWLLVDKNDKPIKTKLKKKVYWYY